MSALAYKQINAPGLSVNGKNWLTRAIDPFHDVQNIPLAGLPDYTPFPTLVKEHTRSLTIECPGEDPVIWNAAFFTLPTMSAVQLQKGKEYATGQLITDGPEATEPVYGTVTCVTWPAASGDDWFSPTTENKLAVGAEVHHISVTELESSSFDRSLSRLIGGGFEVNNTTNKLHVQGKVTTGNFPQLMQRDMAFKFSSASGSGSTVVTSSPLFKARLPPTNQETVRATPSSETWHAEEGCYVPFRMDHMHNDFEMDHGIPVVFSIAHPETESKASAVNLVSACKTLVTGEAPNTKNFFHHTPISSSVAIFTGLSAETTLDLNVKFIEEVAPVTDLQLLSYGPKMYPADPLALRLYQEALLNLPTAVPFADNASARFWSKAVDVISKIASPLVGAAFGPTAGAAVGIGGKAISDILAKKALQQEQKLNQINAKVSKLKIAKIPVQAVRKKK